MYMSLLGMVRLQFNQPNESYACKCYAHSFSPNVSYMYMYLQQTARKMHISGASLILIWPGVITNHLSVNKFNLLRRDNCPNCSRSICIVRAITLLLNPLASLLLNPCSSLVSSSFEGNPCSSLVEKGKE